MGKNRGEWNYTVMVQYWSSQVINLNASWDGGGEHPDNTWCWKSGGWIKVTVSTCSGLRNCGQATFLLGYSCECWCHLQNFWLCENLGLCWGKSIEWKMDKGNLPSPETVDWMVFLPQHELKQAFWWVGPRPLCHSCPPSGYQRR